MTSEVPSGGDTFNFWVKTGVGRKMGENGEATCLTALAHALPQEARVAAPALPFQPHHIPQ